MDKPTITFVNTTSSKAKKTWYCSVKEDLELKGCSANLQAMIHSALDLWDGFTLEELANNAVLHHNLETKSEDMHALGYTHRPKLIELGIITEGDRPEPEPEESEDIIPEQDCSDVAEGLY